MKLMFNIVSCMTMVIIFLMCANPGNGGKVKLPVSPKEIDMACNLVKAMSIPLKDCSIKLKPLTQTTTYAATKDAITKLVCTEIKNFLPESSNSVCAQKLEPFADYILDHFVIRE